MLIIDGTFNVTFEFELFNNCNFYKIFKFLTQLYLNSMLNLRLKVDDGLLFCSPHSQFQYFHSRFPFADKNKEPKCRRTNLILLWRKLVFPLTTKLDKISSVWYEMCNISLWNFDDVFVVVVVAAAVTALSFSLYWWWCMMLCDVRSSDTNHHRNE